MANKRFGIATAVLVGDAVLLLIVGAAMWSAPPSPAEEAVGKGLMALGVALAILHTICGWSGASPDGGI